MEKATAVCVKEIMDDDENDTNHSHSIEPTIMIAQRNDENTMLNIDTIHSKEEKENLTANRRRARMKFAYSFDNDRILPITQTTVIKTEPCFKVIIAEDEATKDFYRNKPNEHRRTQINKQNLSNEYDSFKDNYLSQPIKGEEETTLNDIDVKHPVSHRIPSSSCLKSILKKSQNEQKKEKEKTSTSKLDQSSLKSRSRSSSSSSSSRSKQTSDARIDLNDVQHLAEMTAKQNLCSPSIYTHSLFDQTINIFDLNNPRRITSSTHRPSRFQYYIKPYRGEPPTPTNINKQRSRSLQQQPLPSKKQSTRKYNVSWSPVRSYIYDGRDFTVKGLKKKEKSSSSKTSSSSLSTNISLPGGDLPLRRSPAMVPICVPSLLLSTNSYSTPSSNDRPSIPISFELSSSNNNEEINDQFGIHSSDTLFQHKKDHDETIERYDRLLEKMRATDEELQSLSRSWTNSTQQKTSVKLDRKSNLLSNKITSESHFLSPMMVQICLIILIIFNLLVLYFFHEINVWWSENIAPGMVLEQQKEDVWNF